VIKFIEINKEPPYLIFKESYCKALEAGQKNIEAIAISSFNTKTQEVDSRFVNLKFIANDEFIFFSNYDSPKALSFKSHNQIAALIFWPSINVQIRMKALIKKTSAEYNQKYFFNRSMEKNALAISSNQSRPVHSFSQVKKNFHESLSNDDLKKCPEYWGGYSFIPYEIEIWEGDEFRLNKRNLYKKDKAGWHYYILEP
jgi:pyridoxamine 5'-phosphate oxidase